MPPNPPFVDPTTGELDTSQILSEAIPLAKLIALFVAISLVPLVFVFFAFDSVVGAVLILIAQFVLAVGTGVVLVYVVARGVQLSGE